MVKDRVAITIKVGERVVIDQPRAEVIHAYCNILEFHGPITVNQSLNVYGPSVRGGR